MFDEYVAGSARDADKNAWVCSWKLSIYVVHVRALRY
jgi:hypothetical protein